MKIVNLTANSTVYTSNVYLVTGSWNTLSDLNTLVDVGRDPAIFQMIEEASTGVGKKKIDQVILTHNHYDHAELLKAIKDTYHPNVLAYSNSNPHVDRVLSDGEWIKMGEHDFQVIHATGHSGDSICLYNPEKGVLFAGDTPLDIKAPYHSYDEKFIAVIERLSKLDIKTIYFGHGSEMRNHCNATIMRSLNNISKN